MKRDEILNMPAGREMDALIWKHVYKSTHPKPPVNDFPSTDVACAWEVVEKIIELFGCDVSAENRADIHAHIRVCICKFQYGKLEYDNPNLLLYVFGETISLAICRAALLAVMEFDE